MADVPGAPWSVRAQAVVWGCRGDRSIGAALAPPVRGSFSGRGLTAGLVRYTDTPVGPYDEVFAAVGALGRPVRATIPFIAVDSEPSVAGGRTNWALPKVAASFEGGPLESSWSVTGEDWKVTIRPRAYGPRVPIVGNSVVVQPWPDGRARAAPGSSRGRGRLALITVEVEAGPDISALIRPGRHAGMVIDDLSFTLGVPT